jgi:tetratricopeptide (TPR) repeat protein
MSADHPAERLTVTGDTAQPDVGDIYSLPTLAVTQPARASLIAQTVLDGRPSTAERSLALHALTIVARDSGRTSEALAHARAALTSSRAAGPEREAELRATFGTTLLFAGQTTKALVQLDRALELARGHAVARVLHLRGCTYWVLGRYPEALDDLTSALAVSRATGDRLWEGRIHGSRADVWRALGETRRSAADSLRAEEILTEIGQDLEATLAVRNRAQVAFQEGDVVSALTLIEKTEDRYRAAGLDPVEHLVEHALVLLTARLASEARSFVESVLERTDLAPVWQADLLVIAARAALLDNDLDAARRHAEEARRLFRRHRRPRHAAGAHLLALEAGYAMIRDRPTPPDSRPPLDLLALDRRARAAVRQLRELSDRSLPEALVLAAEVARDLGHTRRSARALAEAARGRRSGTALAQAAGWLAATMLAEQRADRRALRHASRRGLDAVDEHRRLIGDLELRALATGYGLEFAGATIADAAAHGEARNVLWWAERWRATSLRASVAPPDDPALRRDIAALRDVTRRLGTSDDSSLSRERSRLEAAVRRRYRSLVGSGGDADRPDIPALLELLGDRLLLYLVSVRGVLYGVVAADGRIRLHVLGDDDTAAREQQHARFTLRRAAFGRVVDLATAGRRLQRGLLGELRLPSLDRPVLIVPPASLLTVPFGLFPAFVAADVTVAPSLSQWRSALEREPPEPGAPVALVVGPGLGTQHREITIVAGFHQDPIVLAGQDATIERTLQALTGAKLGHIAAHGNFRADAPLFSSLSLSDGPLMVHDLDRLARPPDSVILSACDSGGVHPLGADEALGLVSSLLGMGTRSVLASVEPVNDAATVTVMRSVHDVASRGETLAQGLLTARRQASEDRLTAATVAAFNVWGA